VAAPAAAPVVAPAPAAAAPVAKAADAAKAEKVAAPAPTVINAEYGQPHAGEIGLQKQVTSLGERAAWMHNAVLMPLMVIISLFVLALMLWIVVRFRRRANPVPSTTTHNLVIEYIWTFVPILILAGVAIPSISLLAAQFKPAPDNAITLKVIGNQWNWSYEYPDHGIEMTANMLKEKGGNDPAGEGQRVRTDADGPRLLAVDERVVLPVGRPIKVLVTASDVIHSWAVPAFWFKLDGVPGRINEKTLTIDKPGVYFGQCSELCGVRHGFMPIAVEAVPEAQFNQWVKSKGGKLPGEEAAASAAAAPAASAAASAPAAAPAK
jgi:cytochrome c oxidase subunit 2